MKAKRLDKAIMILRCIMAVLMVFTCVNLSVLVYSSNANKSYAVSGAEEDDQASGEDSEQKSKLESIELKAFPIDQNDNWDTNEKATKKISTRGGQLRISVGATWQGATVWEHDTTAWEDKGGLEDGFLYTITAGKGNISVDSLGVVTALKDGTATVKVTPNNEDYSDITAEITFTTYNQSAGMIVSKIAIVDKDGNEYGDDPLILDQSKRYENVYIRVTYKDPDTGKTQIYSSYPSAPSSEKPKSGAFDTVAWSVGDDNYASVSSSKGSGKALVKAIADAVTNVRVTITGGDASKNGGKVKATITLKINNGKQVDGNNPASSLKVNVCYEDSPDKIISSKTYTKKQFEALGAVTRTYTLTQSSGKYVTDKAYGVPIATLLKSMQIETDDIKYFTMAANDGANPGKITAKWLLKTTRYYYPNYDLGGSRQEKEQVPTMLALKDSWNSNTTDTSAEMNSGTCFRLVFGSASSADSATDKSIKFIHTFTIVMAGSPPSSHGDENNNEISGGGSGGSGGSVGTATSGSGAGTSGGSGVGATMEKMDADTQWRIYQMMNKSTSNVVPIYEDNPLNYAFVPALILLLLVAGAERYLSFKRKLL